MIKQRPDFDFSILSKRIDCFFVSLPDDSGDGYDNVNIGCTVENQTLANYRSQLFLSYPIKLRFIACGPLLGPVDLAPYLGGIGHVTVNGESGREARECDYDWIFSNSGAMRERRGCFLVQEYWLIFQTRRCGAKSESV